MVLMMRFLPDVFRWFAGCLLFCLTTAAESAPAPPVELREVGDSVILSNGTIEATLEKSTSRVISMRLGEHEMIARQKGVYYSMGGGKEYRQPRGAAYRVVKQTPEIVDVAFLQKWKPGCTQAVDIEVHYVLKRGESGVHTYGILSHPPDYPETVVGEWRMVWGMPQKNERDWLMEKIRVDRLRNWEMPSPADLAVAKPTDIKEIVKLTSGVRAGKYDCKYDFNLEYYTTGCWGHASDKNRVGAWIVLGSHEFFNDGPPKQDLSSASSLIHIHFGMNHYGGSSTKIASGEEWRKIYGPFLLYCNQGGDADALWLDAHAKAASERKLWPHAWLEDAALYPPRAARGIVRGRLTVQDRLKPAVSAARAWVGLSQPKPGGNWQMESNGYQYWTRADATGNFEIPHVRPGTYTLNAFVDGAVGEFEMPGAVVKSGIQTTGELLWEVPRSGNSLVWEIGIPDRRASEFRHGNDYFRGYLWREFSKEFANPLVFKVGTSNPATDWNFAQGSYLKNGKCQTWPWEIRFRLDDSPKQGNARLTLSWASADRARVSISANGKPVKSVMPPVSGGNALLREGIHAKYSFSLVDFPTSLLRKGNNTITLTQTRNEGASCHVMYDSLSLELP